MIGNNESAGVERPVEEVSSVADLKLKLNQPGFTVGHFRFAEIKISTQADQLKTKLEADGTNKFLVMLNSSGVLHITKIN